MFLFSMTMTMIARPAGSLCTHGSDLPWVLVCVVFVVLLVASVLASMRWLLCGGDGSKMVENDVCNFKKCRDGFVTITVLINSKNMPASNYEFCTTHFCNHFRRDGTLQSLEAELQQQTAVAAVVALCFPNTEGQAPSKHCTLQTLEAEPRQQTSPLLYRQLQTVVTAVSFAIPGDRALRTYSATVVSTASAAVVALYFPIPGG